MSWRSPSLKSRLIGWPVNCFSCARHRDRLELDRPLRRRLQRVGDRPGHRLRGRGGEDDGRRRGGGGIGLDDGLRLGAQRGQRRRARRLALAEDDLHAVGAFDDAVGRAAREVEHQARDARRRGAELAQAHGAHGLAVHLHRAHRLAGDVLEVEHQAVGVAQEEVLVAQRAVGLDGDGELAVLVAGRDGEDARRALRPAGGPGRPPSSTVGASAAASAGAGAAGAGASAAGAAAARPRRRLLGRPARPRPRAARSNTRFSVLSFE